MYVYVYRKLLITALTQSDSYFHAIATNIGDDRRSVSNLVLPASVSASASASAERTIKYVKLYGARCYWVAAT